MFELITSQYLESKRIQLYNIKPIINNKNIIMRKTVAFTIVFALAICGTTLATVCGDSCASSSDCADAGTCRLCIDGTCQHRCAFHNSQDVPFLGAVCGDACSSSSDCSTAGDCRLCIDGICQHRCANDEPV